MWFLERWVFGFHKGRVGTAEGDDKKQLPTWNNLPFCFFPWPRKWRNYSSILIFFQNIKQKARKRNFHILKRDLFGFASRHVVQNGNKNEKLSFLYRKIKKTIKMAQIFHSRATQFKGFNYHNNKHSQYGPRVNIH